MIIGKNRAALIAALAYIFVLAQTATAQPQSASLDRQRADAATVIVKQGDVAVTLGDVDTWMLEVPEQDRAGFIRSPERVESMLFQLLLLKQANVDARKAKLDQDPLVAAHMRMASERTLAKYQMDAMRKSIKSPDFNDLAHERYLSNREQFRQPSIANLVHLLITEGERGPEEAEKLIQKLYRQALKNPAKLEQLVAKYSDDASKGINQGRLKDISLATLDPDFARAAGDLTPGQLSEPVKSQFGWHIIRLDAIQKGRLPEFDEVKASIIAKMEQEYSENTFRSYVNSLREKSLDPNPAELEKLPFRYGGSPDDSASTAPAPAAPSAEK
jgi:parvulin-like peptidyl-prolyl isomerase